MWLETINKRACEHRVQPTDHQNARTSIIVTTEGDLQALDRRQHLVIYLLNFNIGLMIC